MSQDDGGVRVAAARQQAEHGLESKLWATADALRGSMDASEYKNVVLGLIFLKYVSDASLLAQRGYPPDYSDEAIELVLKQTEVFAEKWATGDAA